MPNSSSVSHSVMCLARRPNCCSKAPLSCAATFSAASAVLASLRRRRTELLDSWWDAPVATSRAGRVQPRSSATIPRRGGGADMGWRFHPASIAAHYLTSLTSDCPLASPLSRPYLRSSCTLAAPRAVAVAATRSVSLDGGDASAARASARRSSSALAAASSRACRRCSEASSSAAAAEPAPALACGRLPSPSELVASPSELLASPSELLASPSELLASPSEL
jgi:hypothetical protein